jgi:hypothetical protein
MAGGTRLGLSVTCTAANILIVQVNFPRTVKLQSQRPFPSAHCQASTPRTWNCLFASAIPANVKVSGSVKFAKAIPRVPQHAQVLFYEAQAGEAAALLPNADNVDPVPFVGTFKY